MPAYRSEAETEVRQAVIDRLRSIRPKARIIHEINNGMGNRFDLLAVSPSELIAVEIKSEKDTLDLLPAQIKGMSLVAHSVIIAHHVKHKPERIGQSIYWRYPEEKLESDPHYLWYWKWSEPPITLQKTLPHHTLNMIWKNELLAICKQNSIKATSLSNCDFLRQSILWNMSGEKITKAICGTLRSRVCTEADPPILHSHQS